MNQELKDRVIIAINGYIPSVINDYVEENAKDKAKLANLALTLKHWANPLGSYSIALTQAELDDEFKHIQEWNNDPAQVLRQENFTAADKAEIRVLLNIKFNALADEIVKEYRLDLTEQMQQMMHLKQTASSSKESAVKVPDQSAIRQVTKAVEGNRWEGHSPIRKISPYQFSSIQPAKTPADKWWESKTPAQQEEIYRQQAQLSIDQQKYIKSQIVKDKPAFSLLSAQYILIDQPTTTYCYYMCNHRAALDALAISDVLLLTEASLRIAALAGRVAVDGALLAGQGVMAAGRAVGHLAQGADDNKKEIAAIIAFLTLLTAGLAGLWYSCVKAGKALSNLKDGMKIGRSVCRLLGLAAGGAGGVWAGMSLGATLGSILPIIGTATGTVIGGICGGFAGGALGVAVVKYSLQLISYWQCGETNPAKWQLSEQEKVELDKKGLDTEQIQGLLTAIKREKQFLGSDEARVKFNHECQQVKAGKVGYSKTIGKNTFFPCKNVYKAQEPSAPDASPQPSAPVMGL